MPNGGSTGDKKQKRLKECSPDVVILFIFSFRLALLWHYGTTDRFISQL
jgi:hypothetical protein